MKTQLPFFCFVLKLLIFSPLNLSSQEVIFSKVAEMNPAELGYEGVTDIAQDPDGYMWFATLNGLYRYDGYRVTAYKNDPHNPNSLANNHLNSIFVDDSGLIWVGTFGKGMDCLNPQTGMFKHYRYNSKDKKSISSDSVIVIRPGKEGTLWLGTMNGLNNFDIHTGEATRYMHQEKDPNSISHPQVRTIYTDKQGTTWFGTASPFYNEGGLSPLGGLNRFNPEKRNFTRYLHDDKNPNTLINNHVTALFEDSRGDFWVGTMGDGLHLMDRKKGTFKRLTYDPAHPEKLSRPPLRYFVPYAGDFISFINEDPNHNLWIGSFSGGVNRFDPSTKKITFFDATSATNSGLNARCYFTSFVSRDSVLWIAPWLEQLYKADLYQKKLPFVSFDGILNGVIKKSKDAMWLYGDMGLIRKDLKTGSEKIFTHDPRNPNSLSNNFIFCIEEGKNHKWWIATANGLDYFDPQTESFIHYQHDLKHKNSLSHNYVTVVKEAGHNLWIATLRGLDRLDLNTGKFTHYPYDLTDPENTQEVRIKKIHVKDKHLIWLVNEWGGVSVFNVKTKTLSKTRYLEDKNVNCIFKDHRGTIWATSNGGLFQYDEDKDVFTRFIDPHRFTKLELVIDIQEDSKKNLWILSHSAIHKISPNRDYIYTYGSDYGVQKYLFFAWYSIKAPSDEVFFIHSYSYVNFNENELKGNPVPPQIAIGEIQIAGDSTNNGAATKRILYKQQKLDLKYRQNTFSITFSPIHYANPLENKIIFKLDKIDTDWRESGNEGKAYYFNLPPNTYTFRLKASNNTGVLTERTLTITITPPWWRTWWAYGTYLILLALAGWRVHLYLKERTIKKEREKNQARELEQAKAIEKAYTELAMAHKILKSTQAQLIQSEKLASLGELTAGIAHEIQNPLNFVNNFAEVSAEMLDEMHEELEKGDTTEAIAIATDLKTNLEKINHHGQRASSIVKGMLEHSRASTGVKEPTDLNALADEYLRLAYHGLRAKDGNFNATLETHFDPDLPMVSVITQDIGRVLLNLINNAFYAVAERSRSTVGAPLAGAQPYVPTVTVSTKKLENAIEVRVQDNGNGIPEAIRDKIFQPFFTTKPTGQGTGLGLSLAYDIVTKGHGGTMEMESMVGEGTEFVIQFSTKLKS